jgi:uncharacterized glyoxalase superfamily protein PhnB
MTTSQVLSVAPYFVVDNVIPAAEFYRDKLGFQFDRFWGEPPSFVMVCRDHITIMLSCVGKSGVAKPNRTIDPEACWDAYIWVRDAQALYDEFQAKGVTITRPIERTHYGCFGQILGP